MLRFSRLSIAHPLPFHLRHPGLSPLAKARPTGSGVADAECGDCLLPHCPSSGIGYTCCVPSPRAFSRLEPPPLSALVLLWLVLLIEGGPVPVTSGSSAPSLDAGTSWVPMNGSGREGSRKERLGQRHPLLLAEPGFVISGFARGCIFFPLFVFLSFNQIHVFWGRKYVHEARKGL